MRKYKNATVEERVAWDTYAAGTLSGVDDTFTPTDAAHWASDVADRLLAARRERFGTAPSSDSDQDHITPAEIVDRDELAARYPKPQEEP